MDREGHLRAVGDCEVEGKGWQVVRGGGRGRDTLIEKCVIVYQL